MQQSKQRNSSVELLRFCFMVMIVIGHVYAHGSDLDYPLIYSWGTDVTMFWHLSMFALSKLGVTGFIFISGYYGIRMKKTKWINILMLCLFYYVIINQGQNWKGAIYAYESWWYVSSYLVICLLSPLIESGIKSLGEKSIRYAVIGLLFYNYVGRWIAGENSHDTVLLITIYVTARYLKEFTPPISSRFIRSFLTIINQKLELSTIVLGLLVMLTPVIAVQLGVSDNNISKIISNNNVILLIFATLLLKSAEKHNTYNKYINWLASSVLAIYLITDYPTVRNVMCTWLFPYMMNGTGYLLILCICIACIIIDKLRDILFMCISRLLPVKYF